MPVAKSHPEAALECSNKKRRLKAEGVTFNGETVLKDFIGDLLSVVEYFAVHSTVQPKSTTPCLESPATRLGKKSWSSQCYRQ